MKEYVSHSAAWVDFNADEITIDEIIKIGEDIHKIIISRDGITLEMRELSKNEVAEHAYPEWVAKGESHDKIK